MMSDIKTVHAWLAMHIYVDCPECDYLIDLLREDDTNGVLHDDEGALMRQVFPVNGSHEDFECDDVTCTKCKTTFNVRELDW